MSWQLAAPYVTFGLGGVTTLLLLFRILIVLEQEFSDEERLVKEPLNAAADPSLTYAKFRAEEWQGFAALWVAMRFRVFLTRFHPLLDPRLGKVSAMILIALYIGLLVPAFVEGWPEAIQGGIAVMATILNTCWLVVIEKGKSLKKSVAKLAVAQQ